MTKITLPIIPINQIFYNSASKEVISWPIYHNGALDYKSIATFCALGFMLDDDTYYDDIKICKPSTEYQINENNQIIYQQKAWNWHYSPKERSFDQTLDKFATLFEK